MRSIAPPTPIRRPAFFVWAPIVILVLMLLLEQTKFFERIKLTTENLRMDLRNQAGMQPPPAPELLLVSIGEKSLSRFGGWPWPRSTHGNLLQLLTLAPPAVLGWDILFVDKGAEGREAEDQFLAKGASKANYPIITGAQSLRDAEPKYDPNQKVSPLDLDLGKTQPLTRIEGDLRNLEPAEGFLIPIKGLRENSLIGCVNAEPQVDGIRHKIPLVFRWDNKLLPGLSLQALMQYWKLAPDQITVKLGDAIYLNAPNVKRRIPIDEQGMYHINYRYEQALKDKEGKITKPGFDSEEYESIVIDLLSVANGKSSELPPVKDKILMVGQVAVGLSDLGPSPLASLSPLVLVHMNIINNILQEDYIKTVPPFLVWIVWLFFSIGTLAWFERKTFGISALIPCCMIIAYVLFAIALFVSKSILIPITMPTLGFFLLHVGAIGRRVIVEEQDKRRMRMAFTAYLAPNVLEKIIENRTSLKLGGERKEVAVLFSDIRGFTSLSETVGEEALVTQLNEYLTVMVDCVNRYGGTLHKFIGDAILAVWGDTLSEGAKKDCTQSLNAALAMRMELLKLNARWKQENRPLLKIGIGINLGHVIVGNIGAPQRMEFTVIGDTVNTASRLEGVTKQYKLDLVVSDTFAERVEAEFAIQTLGLVRPPGKAEGVKIFHPMAPKSVFSAEDQAWLESYEKGMVLYFGRKFEEALAIFESCHASKPDNYPAELHVKLAKHHIENPPDESWTGLREVEK